MTTTDETIDTRAEAVTAVPVNSWGLDIANGSLPAWCSPLAVWMWWKLGEPGLLDSSSNPSLFEKNLWDLQGPKMEFQQFQISACSRGSLSLGKRLIPNAGLPITTASASVHKCSRAELIAKFQITSRPEKGSQNPQKQSAPKQYRAESTHFLETCASSFCVCVCLCDKTYYS